MQNLSSKECAVEGCHNPVASVTHHNNLYSTIFCEEHSKGINVKCSKCGKDILIKSYKYLKSDTKQFTCNNCSRALNITKYNKSDRHKLFAKNHIIEVNNTEAAKKRCISNAANYRASDAFKQHMAEHNKSDAMCKLSKLNFTYKYCNVCKSTTFHVGNRCVICKPWPGPIGKGMELKWCNNCKKETFHVGNRCFNCNPWKTNNSFNRDLFYSDKLNLITFSSLNRDVMLTDIDKYKGIPGVWCKLDHNGIVLDVSQTKDLQKEMLFSIRALAIGKKNNLFSDEQMELKYKNKSGIYKKYRNIAKNGVIIFKIIAIEEDKEKRLAIEAQYAHDTQAEFWSPEPGQSYK
jgi:hypothetical protein